MISLSVLRHVEVSTEERAAFLRATAQRRRGGEEDEAVANGNGNGNGDAEDAHAFVSGLLGWMLEGLDETGRGRALDALHATMAAHETPDGVLFESAAWLIRARRS